MKPPRKCISKLVRKQNNKLVRKQNNKLIRKRGLKVRMGEPAEFLKRMNRLCIKMTHARRRKDARRVRKATLRAMKKLSKLIAAHAEIANGPGAGTSGQAAA